LSDEHHCFKLKGLSQFLVGTFDRNFVFRKKYWSAGLHLWI